MTHNGSSQSSSNAMGLVYVSISIASVVLYVVSVVVSNRNNTWKYSPYAAPVPSPAASQAPTPGVVWVSVPSVPCKLRRLRRPIRRPPHTRTKPSPAGCVDDSNDDSLNSHDSLNSDDSLNSHDSPLLPFDPRSPRPRRTRPPHPTPVNPPSSGPLIPPTVFPPSVFPPTGFPPSVFPPTWFPPTGFPPTGFPPTGFPPSFAIPPVSMPDGLFNPFAPDEIDDPTLSMSMPDGDFGHEFIRRGEFINPSPSDDNGGVSTISIRTTNDTISSHWDEYIDDVGFDELLKTQHDV
ncbi:hypothetical protein ACHAWX_007748 [Stephanocyclus meneghinianus]